MSTNFSDVLDIAPHKVTVEPISVEVTEVTENTEDEDFRAARQNTYELIELSKMTLNTAVTVANETQNPRALEVLGQLLKTSSEINRQLIQMNKDRADVKSAKQQLKSPLQQQAPQIGTQQNVFVGSSSDLNKMLAERLKSNA